MIIEDGRFAFGFWEGMPYGGSATDKYEDFLGYKNTLSKENVIRHIESLDDWISSELSQDLFTGERFNCGIYMDGNFVFPIDFLRYYKRCNIGIPYEYEAYLREILK